MGQRAGYLKYLENIPGSQLNEAYHGNQSKRDRSTSDRARSVAAADLATPEAHMKICPYHNRTLVVKHISMTCYALICPHPGCYYARSIKDQGQGRNQNRKTRRKNARSKAH